MFIDNADTIIDYMNTGKDSNGNVIENRVISKVSDISIFSHGLRDDGGTLSLDYHSNVELRNADLNIINKELQDYNINRKIVFQILIRILHLVMQEQCKMEEVLLVNG